MRLPYLVALATVLLLLIGALLTWRERMFLLDPAFVSFELINTGGFVISEHRYAAAVTQFFPLATSWLGLPLQLVLLSYAASFYLLYAAVVYWVGVRWRQYELGILLVLYLTLIVSDVFYWPNNEVHQGVAWMVVFLAGTRFLDDRARTATQGSSTPYGHIVLLMVALLLATNAHLLIAMPLLFLWVFLRLRAGRTGFGKRNLLFTVAVGLTVGLRYAMSSGSWYDGAKLRGVSGAGLADLPAALTSAQVSDFLALSWTNYWLLYPLLLLGAYGAVRARAYWVIPLTLGGLLAYATVVGLTYPEGFGRSLRFYYESEWQALALIAAAPFVYYCLPRLGGRWAALLLGMIFLLRIGYLAGSYPYFHQRYENLERVVSALAERGPSRAVLPDTLAPHLLMPWGTAAESFLLSSVRGDRPTVTFLVGDHPELLRMGRDSFRAPFRQHSLDRLSTRYFAVDTTRGYERTTVTGLPRLPE